MEEHFKNKLKNHKVNWDKEELLPQLEKELSTKRSKFGWRWFLLLPIFAFSTYWALNQFDFKAAYNAGVLNERHGDSNQASKAAVNESLVPEFRTGEKSNSSMELLSTDSDKRKLKKIDKEVLSAGDSKFEGSKINEQRSNRKRNRNFEQDDIASQPRTSDKKNNKIQIKNFEQHNSTDERKAVGHNNNLEENKTREQINLFDPAKDKSIFENETSISSQILTESPNSKVVDEKDKQASIPALNIPLLKLSPLSHTQEISFLPVIPNLDESNFEQEKKIAQKKNKFFASYYANSGLTNLSVRSLTERDATEELELNEETVNSRLSLSTDLLLGFQHRSGWTLESGIEYNRIFEFFDFVDTLNYEITEGVNEKAFYFLDQNLDTLFFSDTVSVISSAIRTVKHNNHHTYFNIPLNVGFRYRLGSLNVFNTVGISYAFLHKFKGRETQFQDGGIEVVDDPSFDFKNKLGFRLGMGLEYPLSPHSQVFSKVSYHRSPRFARSQIGQKYNSYALGLGIKISIN